LTKLLAKASDERSRAMPPPELGSAAAFRHRLRAPFAGVSGAAAAAALPVQLRAADDGEPLEKWIASFTYAAGVGGLARALFIAGCLLKCFFFKNLLHL
jgi:hypothetical protein